MKTNYNLVVIGLFLFLVGINLTIAQSGPEFINCPSSPVSFCVNDPGVRLPANNQIYSSEADSNATSCSVHITQSIKVKSNCGHQLQYEVRLFLDDTSNAYLLQPLTYVFIDSLDEFELIFNSEMSPDSYIRENGIPYNTGCHPYYRINWVAMDTCHNINVCEQFIRVYDCQAPHLSDPPDFPIIITIPIGCGLHLFAKDYALNILDDCSSENEFLFSLKEEKYLPDSAYYNPCDIPAVGVELPFDIWIADNGIDGNCNGSIEWTERNKYKQTVSVVYSDYGGGCLDCGSDDVVIQGQIATEDVQTVELVSVTAETPGHIYQPNITGKDGIYQFLNIAVPTDITITAERNDNYRNGVSMLDIVRIQKHLLGIEGLGQYDLIAADANNSSSVSAIDLVELRKLILGIYTVLPNNKSWRFVPDKIIGNTGQNLGNLDFIAIKVGDVNNTVQAHAQSIVPRDSYKTALFTISPKQYQANEVVNIDFSIKDITSFDGFQFTLSDPDFEFLGASSNLIDLAEDDYALFGDRMTMSWFTLEELPLHPGDIVFTIKAISKRAGDVQQSLQLNSDITEAEMYSTDDEIYIPKILVKSNDAGLLTLFATEPNPWSTTCKIPFYIQKANNVLLTVYTTDGTKVFSEEKYYSSGYHEMELNANDIRSNGLLFFNLQNEKECRSGKCILLR